MIDRTRVCEPIPIDRLRPGQSAWIDRFVGCTEHVRRLEEMGLRPGMQVKVVRHGRPCIIRAGGYRLGFRCSDVLGVMVCREQPPGS